MLTATGLSLAFGPQTILDNVNLTIGDDARVGLVGANGSGKTSLLQILAGERSPDAGAVVRNRGSSLAYLPQRLEPAPDQTVRALADEGFSTEHRMASEREEIATRLRQQPNDTVGLHRLAEIDEHLEREDYHHRDATIGRILRGLGFAPEDLDRPLGHFSGGWQMRAALARTLLTRADTLLLDEPTNYLDSEARIWLAQFIRSYRGGVVLVSHDRAFLDDVVTSILELFGGALRSFPGDFTTYETRRRAELDQLVAAWKQQQVEIQRQEDFIRRFRAKATKARQVQSRVKMLDKMEPIEIPQHLRPISITLPPPPQSGDVMLDLDGVCRSYGNRPVLRNLRFTVTRGRRWAVVGLNGAGKTTLLRILSGADKPDQGTVRHGSGVRIAYYAQDSADTLPRNETVFEYAAGRAPDHQTSHVRSVLGSFLFDGDAIDKPLSVLSGGERSRLVIAALLLQPANLLILDEPTNHLDMTSQQVLAQALSTYEGSAVVVSHDRAFLRAVATDVLALWPHTISTADRPPEAWRYYPGSYREFEGSHLGEAFLTETPVSPQSTRTERVTPGAAEDYATQKARRAQIRRLEKREAEILERIEELEQAHRSLQVEMAREENYTDPTTIRRLRRELDDNEAEQRAAHDEWETVSEELAAL